MKIIVAMSLGVWSLIVGVSNAMAEELTSYEKYREESRNQRRGSALAWLSSAALEGDHRAILEISAKCLDGDFNCDDISILEDLTKQITLSQDVHLRSNAYLLMSRYELKKAGDTASRFRALDYLMLATAYGEEGAFLRALPLLKSLSEADLNFAHSALLMLTKEISVAKRDTILYAQLKKVEEEIRRLTAGNP